MPYLFDQINEIFEVKNKNLLYELLFELSSKHPQINPQTKVKKSVTDCIIKVEARQPLFQDYVPKLSKRPGFTNRLKRIVGEIIPIKKLENAGFELLVHRLIYPPKQEIRFKDYHISRDPDVIQIRYLYLAENDTLFINRISEYRAMESALKAIANNGMDSKQCQDFAEKILKENRC